MNRSLTQRNHIPPLTFTIAVNEDRPFIDLQTVGKALRKSICLDDKQGECSAKAVTDSQVARRLTGHNNVSLSCQRF